MGYTYWLPDERGQKKIYTTDTNSIIIIGANGAGKSKLGAWIEQQDFEKVHRVGAQRNLCFNDNIALKSYEEAEDYVFYGAHKNHHIDKRERWGWDSSYTTTMISDFESVLAALIAMKNNENDCYIEECKNAERNGSPIPKTVHNSIDKLKEIWNSIFPHRQISLNDSKFCTMFDHDNQTSTYSSNQMSDGERSVLYFTAQILCVPHEKILVIDEPELHLHRSLMNRLWSKLEEMRADCLFIYITHDTQFAAIHPGAEKIWIKDFDGEKWSFERIYSTNLPEELLLDVLGNRKDVLFVEGEQGSYDSQLYPFLYPNYHVIPCGSCTQVIMRTKAFRGNPSLHHCNVYGIIDRDYRSEHEIDRYRSDGIYTINVAEVENLFVVEDVIRFMAVHMGKDADEIFNQVKKYVIETRYGNQINRQICQSVVSEIKYRLSSIEIPSKDDTEAKESLNNAIHEIKYDEIQAEHEGRFREVLARNNYADVLKVFNEKSIASSVGHFFGIDDRQYCSTIIGLLRGVNHDEIVASLTSYLPPEIPR